MIELDSAVSIVNQQVPKCKLRLFQPHEMQATRTSNCVGRAVLAYTLLRAMGMPDSEFRLLIGNTHGQERTPDTAWLGHVALLVDGDIQGLIDSSDEAFVRSLDDLVPLPASQGPGYKIGHNTFTVHSVGEGLIAYQLAHPTLAQGPIVTVEDYAEAYEALLETIAPVPVV